MLYFLHCGPIPHLPQALTRVKQLRIQSLVKTSALGLLQVGL